MSEMEEKEGTWRRPSLKNFQRRSSIQKLMHICNQSCQVFPLAYVWVQDFQTTINADIRKIIPVVKSVPVLPVGIYLSIFLLTVELLYCLSVAVRFSVPSGLIFLLFCTGLLSVMALQIFDVVSQIKKTLRITFFVKKKKQ